jgi:hypothetical protein
VQAKFTGIVEKTARELTICIYTSLIKKIQKEMGYLFA